MTRKELAKKLNKKMPNMSLSQVIAMLDTLFKEISINLQQGKKIEMRGLGIFYLGSIKAHMAKDPRNGTPVKVPKKNRPLFRPSITLMEKIK